MKPTKIILLSAIIITSASLTAQAKSNFEQSAEIICEGSKHRDLCVGAFRDIATASNAIGKIEYICENVKPDAVQCEKLKTDDMREFLQWIGE